METTQPIQRTTISLSEERIKAFKNDLFQIFDDTIPHIEHNDEGYQIRCRFPSFYREIIPYIAGNSYYRQRLTELFEEEIKKIFLKISNLWYYSEINIDLPLTSTKTELG